MSAIYDRLCLFLSNLFDLLLTQQPDLRTFEGAKVVDKLNEAKPTREAVARARNFRRRQTLEEIDPLDP